jgi:hypothetical protein
MWVSERPFCNGVAHEVLRPVAKIMPVLLNTTRLVKATEKVNEPSNKTMEHLTQLWIVRTDLMDAEISLFEL